MGKLEGKIALVTGGNGRIDLATAKQFVNKSRNGAALFQHRDLVIHEKRLWIIPNHPSPLTLRCHCAQGTYNEVILPRGFGPFKA